MRRRLQFLDWTFVVVPFILSVLSVATIYTITYGTVGSRLAINQAAFVLIGFALMAFFSFFDYRHLKALAWLVFGLGVVLLIPMLPWWGERLPFVLCQFNACRWLDFGLFQFQTSELFKVITPLLLAALLSNRQGTSPWWSLLLYLGLLAIPVSLVLAQPDLGTGAVIFLAGLTVLLFGRFPSWLWLVLALAALVALPIVWRELRPYQKQRIEVFLNPRLDPNKIGYNIRQAEIAVGSGGILGRGFGRGSQSQLNFLPVAHTDFIFAGFAEATGFIGSLVLIVLFLVLVSRALRAAQIAKDIFGRLTAVGLTATLTVQIFTNLGMTLRLAPVTGIPLPLVSYGGTSLFVTMIALGILQSIVLRHKKITFA